MASPLSSVQSELERPIVFRTTTETAYRSTVENGEIWLRSDEYFRKLEDKVRNDQLESASAGQTVFPLLLNPTSGPTVHLSGDGHIAETLAPHYILSLHGSSITEATRKDFGGFTFGVKDIDLLARHLCEECEKQIGCQEWRWEQVRYQHSALTISENANGAPFQFGHNPTRCLRIFYPIAFRKRPVPPFIHQDEWRIVIWTNGYIRGDAKEPLKVRVPPSLFYRYIEGAT